MKSSIWVMRRIGYEKNWWCNSRGWIYVRWPSLRECPGLGDWTLLSEVVMGKRTQNVRGIGTEERGGLENWKLDTGEWMRGAWFSLSLRGRLRVSAGDEKMGWGTERRDDPWFTGTGWVEKPNYRRCAGNFAVVWAGNLMSRGHLDSIVSLVMHVGCHIWTFLLSSSADSTLRGQSRICIYHFAHNMPPKYALQMIELKVSTDRPTCYTC